MKFNTRARHSIFSFLILAVFVLGLQACGGGSSSTPLPDQDGSGIYTGTATVDVNTDITDLRGIVYDGRLLFFSETATPHVLYDGTVTSITSDDYTATVDVYENGVKTQTAVAVTGKVLTANKITGTIGTAGSAGNHNGTFTLNYDSIYTRGATTARIEAIGVNKATGSTYGTLDLSAGYSFSTDLNAVLNTFSGVIACTVVDVYSIPDSSVNVYAFTNFSIVEPANNCPDTYEGTGYSGLFSVVDDGVGGTDNRIIIAYSNGTNSVFGFLTK